MNNNTSQNNNVNGNLNTNVATTNPVSPTSVVPPVNSVPTPSVAGGVSNVSQSQNNAVNSTVSPVNTNVTPTQTVAVNNTSETKSEESQKVVFTNKTREEIERDYKPLSPFKTVMLVIFLVSLIAFVWFLPDISKFVSQYNEVEPTNNIITTGTLECTFNRSTENLDITYKSNFAFTDSKLTKLTYIVNTRGDADLDKDILDKTEDKCENIKTLTSEMVGIDVFCTSKIGQVESKQVFNYSELDPLTVTTAFTEAGGIYPEFEYKDNIDNIETKMFASGYDCSRKS